MTVSINLANEERKQPIRGPGRKGRKAAQVNLAYLQTLLERGMVTGRDEDLLRTLAECRVLSTDQAHRLFWAGASVQAARRRLRHLYDLHLLDRTRSVMKEMRAKALAPGCVYTLGKAGMLWLRQTRRLRSRGRRLRLYALAAAPYLIHDLCTTEIMVRLAEAVAMRQGVELAWTGEAGCRVKQDQKVLLEPDARAVLSYDSGCVAYYIERDMGAEGGKSFERKVQRYDRYYNLGVWRERMKRFPAVAVVTLSDERARNLAHKVAAVREKPVVWLLSSDDAVGAEGILGPVWQVVTPGGELVSGQRLLPL